MYFLASLEKESMNDNKDSLNMNWVGLWTLTSREVGRFFSVYRQTVIPGLISSILYILIFGFTLERRISTIDGIPYTLFIIPGLIMMNTLTNATSNSASSMLQMKLLGQLPDLLQAPLSSFEISLAYIIGGTVRGVVNGILVLLLGYFLTGFHVVSWCLTIMYLISVAWAFAGAGVIVGIYAKSWDSIMVITNFFFMPLIFLGGVFYSIEMLPEFWRNFSMVNPLYWMINGLRYATIGIAETSHELSLGISIVFAIFFSTLASYMFSKGYRIKT